MTTNNTIPRRIQLDLNEPAELAIFNAMQEVEKMGCDVRLTEAVTLLGKAKNLVADVIDEQQVEAYKSKEFVVTYQQCPTCGMDLNKKVQVPTCGFIHTASTGQKEPQKVNCPLGL